MKDGSMFGDLKNTGIPDFKGTSQCRDLLSGAMDHLPHYPGKSNR